MASGIDRMSKGVGAADSNNTDVTNDEMQEMPETGVSGPNSSQGEVGGTGSIYTAQLNERPNISNPRNQGPTRAPSVIGAATIPVVRMAQRHTGKLG